MSKQGIVSITVVSVVGMFFIGGISMVAVSKGIDGMVVAGAFGAIGGIVAGVGVYLRDRLKLRK